MNFIGVDGEGIHDRYVLLAVGEQSLFKREGITLGYALEWWSPRYDRNQIHVAFSFHYDMCKMVESYPDDWILAFMRGQEMRLGDWRIRYLAKHLFRATRSGEQIVLYDVIQFFNRSFERTLEMMGIRDDSGLISWGKAARGTFTFNQLLRIRAYNAMECKLLAQVCEQLRGGMEGVDLVPSSWHGPGALADRALARTGIDKLEIVEHPRREMKDVFDRAYFGGRIETPKLGLFTTDVLGSGWDGVTTYDIRSAYPEACLHLWNQKEGHWFDVNRFNARFPHSVWHLEWGLPQTTYLGPLPWRADNGRIYYPLQGRGWYWFPEASLALRLHGKHVRVLEGHIFSGTTVSKLAATVRELYAKRAALKAARQEMEAYVLKIVLNSLYGKMAQTVGNARFHSRAWAGYVTSWVRAKMREAVYGAEHRVIALATDGLVLDGRERLPLTEGKELGQWEREEWDRALVLGSGIYELKRHLEDGDAVKRGERGGTLDFEKAMKQLNEHDFVRNQFTAFVTPTLAILMPNHFGPWRGKFMPQERIIAPWTDPHAKRIYEWADETLDWSFRACDSKPRLGVMEESTPYQDEDDRFVAPSGALRHADELLVAAD